MWLLMANGLAYLVYGFGTGRFRERLLPIRLADVVETVRETLRFKIAHEDLTVYNAVQKLLYIVAILAGIAQVVTGLAIWKPVQFSGLVRLLGGFQGARLIHFLGMAVSSASSWCTSPWRCWCRKRSGRCWRAARAQPARGARTMRSLFRPGRAADPAILDDHRGSSARSSGAAPARRASPSAPSPC